MQTWNFLYPVYEAGRNTVGLVRLEQIEMGEPYISGDWPWKPSAVIEFEDQEDIIGLLYHEAGTKNVTVIYYAEHGYYPFAGIQGAPVRH